MRNSLCLLALAFTFIYTAAQSQTSAADAQSVAHLKDQASKMGQAFIAANYTVFAQYNNPKIVAMMGGPTNMAATLTKMIGDMKGQGMTFKKISFDEP